MEIHSGLFFLAYVVLAIMIWIGGESDAPIFAVLSGVLFIVAIIWNIISYNMYDEAYDFEKALPIKFEDRTAYAYNDGVFINCSYKFGQQFIPGDSAYVYTEREVNSCGFLYGDPDTHKYFLERIDE